MDLCVHPPRSGPLPDSNVRLDEALMFGVYYVEEGECGAADG